MAFSLLPLLTPVAVWGVDVVMGCLAPRDFVETWQHASTAACTLLTALTQFIHGLPLRFFVVVAVVAWRDSGASGQPHATLLFFARMDGSLHCISSLLCMVTVTAFVGRSFSSLSDIIFYC